MRMRIGSSRPRQLLVAGAVLLASVGHAAADTPIVAVFRIHAQSGTVTSVASGSQDEALDALTDFLTVRLAATGRFRTVPRTQIRQRLKRLRAESYKDCYDQGCQIEIGQELAASKALSARLLGVGEGRCTLALELFDLASAATDAAYTTEPGPCTEGELFGAITAGVEALGSRSPAAAAATAVDPAAASQVSLHVKSDPAGVDVLVDGLYRGKTPLRVAVARGRRLRVTLTRDGYHDVRRTLVPDDEATLAVPMQLTAQGRISLATTSEWFGTGFGVGYLAGADSAMVAANMRFGSLKWHRFFWTLFEFSMLAGDSEQVASTSFIGMVFLSTRLGFPWYLGRRGQHQVLFGLGVGYGQELGRSSSGAASTGARFFALSPGVDYVYSSFGGLIPVGLGARGLLPTAGEVRAADGRYPTAVMLTVNVGLSLSPWFTAAAITSGGRRPPAGFR